MNPGEEADFFLGVAWEKKRYKMIVKGEYKVKKTFYFILV